MLEADARWPSVCVQHDLSHRSEGSLKYRKVNNLDPVPRSIEPHDLAEYDEPTVSRRRHAHRPDWMRDLLDGCSLRRSSTRGNGAESSCVSRRTWIRGVLPNMNLVDHRQPLPREFENMSYVVAEPGR